MSGGKAVGTIVVVAAGVFLGTLLYGWLPVRFMTGSGE